MQLSDPVFSNQFLTLAQDAATPAAPGWGGGDAASTGAAAPLGGGGGGAGPAGSGSFIFLMIGMMVLIVLMSAMSGRKERKRRAALLANLKKHDKVQTIGGIIGTIVELRKEDVVLRVDENSNVRIRFARSAITGVVDPSPIGDRVDEVKVVKNEAEAVGSTN